jgi:hypothetical protein
MSDFKPLQPLASLPKRKSRFAQSVMLGAIIISILLIIFAPGKLYRLTCNRTITLASCQITAQGWRGNPEIKSLTLSKIRLEIQHGKTGGSYGARLRLWNDEGQILFTDNFWATSSKYQDFNKLQEFLENPTQSSIELAQDERFSVVGLIILILMFSWFFYIGRFP